MTPDEALGFADLLLPGSVGSEVIKMEHGPARARRRKSMQAALRAAGENTRGVPREQARAMLIAEFEKQDVDPLPSAAVIEVMLDHLALDSPWKRAVHATGALAEPIRSMFGAARDLKQLFGDALAVEGDPVDVPVDRDAPAIPVPLDQEALQWLNAKFPPGRRPVSSDILVLLQPAGADGRAVAVCHNGHRFGVLDGTDGELFRSYMDEAAPAERPVVAEAIRRVSDDGRWSLDLFRPAE